MTAALEQTGIAGRNSPLLRPKNSGGLDKKTHLVLVDDDNDYREVVSSELEDYGFNVTDFNDGPKLMEYMSAGQDADVIVLDWNLPSIPGIDLVPLLRRRGVRIPIIMLTGMAGQAHEIEALDRGAIDFIDKSRGVRVLARRAGLIATAVKRPTDDPLEESLRHGPLELRPRVCRAFWAGQDVDLTITEFNIVHKLVKCVGEHVSYRAIYDCVHHSGFIAGSGEDGYRTNVRASVKRIRNKFRNADPAFLEIENFPGFGYRWKQRVDAP